MKNPIKIQIRVSPASNALHQRIQVNPNKSFEDR